MRGVLGENAPDDGPLVPVTFADGANPNAPGPLTVQFCRPCLAAVCAVMVHRYNGAVEARNERTAAWCRMLGIEPPT
jgi:hypothetical protein